MEEKSEMAAEGKEGSAEQEQVDKSEISSSLYKGSSEVGTTFVDSAYGSLGHSASSSLGPIVPPTSVFNHLYPQVKSHTICYNTLGLLRVNHKWAKGRYSCQ